MKWAREKAAARHVSHSGAFASGPAYVQLGRPAVPLAMLAYARDQSGWWHELLFDIVHGSRSGQHCVHKPTLYRESVDWFQRGKSVAAAVLEAA